MNKPRVLVFVHGIYGDPRQSWMCPSGAYWPQLVLADEAFKNSNVYVAAYASPYSGNRMSISEVVASLHNRLEDDGIFKHREVVFVSHSLGGLIVQQLLLTYRPYALKVPFIYLFSTPQTGAELAKLGHIFNDDPLLRAMFPGDSNDYLLNLENDWRAAHFNVKRFCAYEKKETNGVLVVDRLSATRSCSETPVPINEDHIGIVKPCSARDDSYIALRNAFNANPAANPPAPGRRSTPPAGSKPATADQKESATGIVASRPYDFTGSRRTKLLALLQQREPRETIRVGCAPRWSEASCGAAANLLLLLSEAGWKIDPPRVFQMEPPFPLAGISIVTDRDPEEAKLPPLPPHLGRWRQATPTTVTLLSAFREMGIPVHFSSQDNLGKGTVGVYIGPEPPKLEIIQNEEKEAIRIAQERNGSSGRSLDDPRQASESPCVNPVRSFTKAYVQLGDALYPFARLITFHSDSEVRAGEKFHLYFNASVFSVRVDEKERRFHVGWSPGGVAADVEMNTDLPRNQALSVTVLSLREFDVRCIDRVQPRVNR